MICRSIRPFPLAFALAALLACVLSVSAQSRSQLETAATPEGIVVEGFEPLESNPGPLAAETMDWSRVYGVNYIPSYAASPYEAWINYDPAKIRAELAAAAHLGFNSIRVIFSYNAYEEKPTPVVDALHDFLTACEENKLTAMIVLFDARGVDAGSLAGGRESARVAYERFTSRKDTYRVRPGFERFTSVMAQNLYPDREVPIGSDPGVLLWGDWQPSPGPKRLNKEEWPRYIDYLKAVILPLKDDHAVIGWDLMNDLGCAHPLAVRPAREGEREFARAMIDEARKLKPSQAVTVGFAGGYPGGSILAQQLDLISVHLPQRESKQLMAEMSETKRLARAKPVILCEGGGVLFPLNEREASEDYQRDFVRRTVTALERERAGFYLWHLIEGKSMTPWAALIAEDGTPKLAAKWFKDRAPRGR